MTTERIVRIVAGSFVLLSVILGARQLGISLAEPSWFWFTLFVGANLLQSGFTRFCPLELILKKLGVRSAESGCGC